MALITTANICVQIQPTAGEGCILGRLGRPPSPGQPPPEGGAPPARASGPAFGGGRSAYHQESNNGAHAAAVGEEELLHPSTGRLQKAGDSPGVNLERRKTAEELLVGPAILQRTPPARLGLAGPGTSLPSGQGSPGTPAGSDSPAAGRRRPAGTGARQSPRCSGRGAAQPGAGRRRPEPAERGGDGGFSSLDPLAGGGEEGGRPRSRRPDSPVAPAGRGSSSG